MTVIENLGIRRIVVLGTGGTIAGAGEGTASSGIEYVAGSVPVERLAYGISVPYGYRLDFEQIAQLDSKDMNFAVWHQLATRCSALVASPEVASIVITHGTDTIEGTAFFLHSVLRLGSKPVILTCAIRPTTAMAADGPQNLQDAIAVATATKSNGDLVVCAGEIHDAVAVRKAHPYRLNAFESGEAGPVGFVEEGTARYVREASHNRDLLCNWDSVADHDPADWPRVEILSNHAGVTGRLVELLIEERRQDSSGGVAGLVIAATGNGSLNVDLEAAAHRAMEAGIPVWRVSRGLNGKIIRTSRDRLPESGGLYPVKARIALMPTLLSGRKSSAV
ncbi:asparaginase [Paraburkholderia sp.]|uniref:asparaginase n=1 Tax=Paraburkholderia sp. TaxID=1926495 RepID=UPI003C7BB4C6